MLNTIIAALSWMVMFVIQLVGIVMGYILVPIGLLFRRKEPTTEKPFTQFNIERKWVYEDLPNWLLYWRNLEDGLRGDHRGWWDAHSFGGDSSRVFNMFWWSAIRNPFNYFKRFVLGCDVRKYHITKLGGVDHVRDKITETGWQFLKATPLKGSGKVLPRYQLYVVKRYGNSDRALVIQLGNKIKLSHNTAVEALWMDYYKGFTFEINPFKNIA